MSLFSKVRERLLGPSRESLEAYRETLTRLRAGGFDGLSPEEKQHHVEQIIQAGARAAVLAGAVPLPLLELPVQGLMVQAIARVHGVDRSSRKVMMELLAAMGGGLLMRQLWRRLPVVGAITSGAQNHTITRALGLAAHRYFATGGGATPGAPEANPGLREVFQLTLETEAKPQDDRMRAVDFDANLRALRNQRDKGELSEEEYRVRRQQLLDQI